LYYSRGQNARYVYISGRKLNNKHNTSDNTYYLSSIDKWSGEQKSHFQLSKMQNMNINKHARNKYRSVVTLILAIAKSHVNFSLGAEYVEV